MKAVVVVLAITSFAVMTLYLFGAYRWSAETRRLRTRLDSMRIAGLSRRVFFSELDNLPAPVRRYLMSVLHNGQSAVSVARFSHRGTFNTSEAAHKWKRFSSDQIVTTRRPGFDWNATVEMLPGISVNVHDAYIGGEGDFHASILGLFSVGRFRGRGPVAESELMRYLAEAAWYPTVLLPGAGVRWECVDDTSARATLLDESVSVTLTFTFDDQNLISTIEAAARWRTVGDRVVPTPWKGRFWNYEERDGMKIPLEGEAAWILTSGPHPYWRGKLTSTSYVFS